jgi:hypothetical protein
MVHFPGLTRTQLCIHRAVIWFYQIGFPHSDIPGSKPACGSPRLIAACHVLRRLLVPRHPPYALSSLTIKLTQHVQIPRGIGTLKPPFLKGLAALLAAFQGCFRSRLKPSLVGASTKAACRGRFAFPQNATLEQNLRFYVLRESHFTSRKTMPASFDCQRPSLQSTPADRSVSVSNGAQC